MHELLIAVEPQNSTVYSHLVPAIVSDLYRRIEELSSKSVVESKKAEAKERLSTRLRVYEEEQAAGRSGKEGSGLSEPGAVVHSGGDRTLSRDIQDREQEEEEQDYIDTGYVAIEDDDDDGDWTHGRGDLSAFSQKRSSTIAAETHDHGLGWEGEEQGREAMWKRQRRHDENGYAGKWRDSYQPRGGLAHQFKASNTQEDAAPLRYYPMPATATATMTTMAPTPYVGVGAQYHRWGGEQQRYTAAVNTPNALMNGSSSSSGYSRSYASNNNPIRPMVVSNVQNCAQPGRFYAPPPPRTLAQQDGFLPVRDTATAAALAAGHRVLPIEENAQVNHHRQARYFNALPYELLLETRQGYDEHCVDEDYMDADDSGDTEDDANEDFVQGDQPDNGSV